MGNKVVVRKGVSKELTSQSLISSFFISLKVISIDLDVALLKATSKLSEEGKEKKIFN
jgi:hypothetical protein